MKVHNLRCQECGTKASGVWRTWTGYTAEADAAILCANCGLYQWAHKRLVFSAGARTELVRSFTTDYIPPTPIREYTVGSKPITEIVVERKRTLHHSSVSPEIINSYRRP